MDRALQDLVCQRAHRRCEYCGFPAEWAYQPFQLDHIIAESHHGQTVSGNLALSCFDCNDRKWAHVDNPDPLTRETVSLFHPRQDGWEAHFEWSRQEFAQILGKTAKGRARSYVFHSIIQGCWRYAANSSSLACS